jgi:hypothetical protein
VIDQSLAELPEGNQNVVEDDYSNPARGVATVAVLFRGRIA